jgi:hypothetical protein
MSIRTVRAMLFALVILAMSGAALGQIGLMITVAPPPLPVYEQPICPDDGYIWTPGYWAYDSDIADYYWVPGTWVMAPEVGFLWTPAYWGWGGDRFVFYDGYWGPLVGFYGGINYGFGYFGVGFEGGRWDNGHFFYNQAVSNVNVTVIHNVYNNRVEERSENRVSYNGGEGGLSARPTPQQEAAARERHLPPVAAQKQHMQEARSNPQQRASVNRGKPEIAATPKPGAYKDRGVVQSKSAGGNYIPPAARGGGGGTMSREGRPENGARPEGNTRPGENARPSGGSTSYNHVRELPPNERSSASGSTDKNYQKQQDKLYSQQQKERDKVAKQQEKEDQRAAQQKNEQAKQQVEQRHQQQTQHLQQKHQQQQQQMQQRQQRQAPRQQSEPSKKPGE